MYNILFMIFINVLNHSNRHFIHENATYTNGILLSCAVDNGHIFRNMVRWLLSTINGFNIIEISTVTIYTCMVTLFNWYKYLFTQGRSFSLEFCIFLNFFSTFFLVNTYTYMHKRLSAL